MSPCSQQASGPPTRSARRGHVARRLRGLCAVSGMPSCGRHVQMLPQSLTHPTTPPPLLCPLPPCLQQLEVGLPDVMMAGVEQYTQYFDETTSKTRRLSWQVRLAARLRARLRAVALSVLVLHRYTPTLAAGGALLARQSRWQQLQPSCRLIALSCHATTQCPSVACCAPLPSPHPAAAVHKRHCTCEGHVRQELRAHPQPAAGRGSPVTC